MDGGGVFERCNNHRVAVGVMIAFVRKWSRAAYVEKR